MSTTPEEVIADLERYISLFEISLGRDARKTFWDIEQFSYKCNFPCGFNLFFSKTIRNSKEIQRFLYSKGTNPLLAVIQLEIEYYNLITTEINYQRGVRLYSDVHERKEYLNTAILDCALQYCVKNEKLVLNNEDILLAAMDTFERFKSMKKTQQNGKDSWNDCKLNTDYLTLAHVFGEFQENLFISFEDLRTFLKGNYREKKNKHIIAKYILN